MRKKKKKDNIYKSAAMVTGFSTVEKSLSFFYKVALTRLIGAEGLGLYQIVLTVFAVFLTIPFRVVWQRAPPRAI